MFCTAEQKSAPPPHGSIPSGIGKGGGPGGPRPPPEKARGGQSVFWPPLGFAQSLAFLHFLFLGGVRYEHYGDLSSKVHQNAAIQQ